LTRICPNPVAWDKAYRRLIAHATERGVLGAPPRPLILAGWAHSSDAQKMERWRETVEWAKSNGCVEIVEQVDDFYMAARI
jgi:hypothetical protein